METIANQRMMVERFRALATDRDEPEKTAKKGPGLGKKLFDFIYNKVLVINTPPTRGKWKGGDPLPDYKPAEMKLHRNMTDNYHGIGVYPSKIAQRIVNKKAHMIVPSNRGVEFDLLMIFIVRLWKYIAKAIITGLLGTFLFFTNPYLWPVALVFFAYSAFFSAQFAVTRSRIIAIRTFAAMGINTGLPQVKKVAKPRVK